jgi:hypothetical protein
MQRVLNIFRVWLPIAVVTAAFCGLAYLTVQQSLRQGANDPQIQMAEDTAAALAQRQTAEMLLPATTVDIARSLAPFMIVYDDAGNVLAASAILHGATPSLPAGVLDYTRTKGEDRVTWQPENGVRIAAVVVRYEGAQPGFVLAGRNMREVEIRETQIEQLAGLAMLVSLVASLVAVAFGEFFLQGKKHV